MLKKNELQNKVEKSFNFQDPFRLEEQLTEEEIQIRRDNGQSLFILSIIILYKSIKNIRRIFNEFN